MLITGATGFIGRHCVANLVSRGHRVHAVGRGAATPDDALVTWHEVDLFDHRRVSELMEATEPTQLLHLAWTTTPSTYWTSPENVRWAEASLHLFQEFVRRGGSRIVGAGTCAEYDWTGELLDERTSPLYPATVYGASKRHTGGLLEALCESTGTSGAWGRVFFAFGPHEQPARLVPSVIRSLLRGEPALCTHGQQIRDLMFVEDVADAFGALLDSGVQGPVNIASGTPVVLASVVSTIAAKLDASHLVRLGALESPAHDAERLVADVRRLRDEVGWARYSSLDRGLERTIDFWRAQDADTNT